MRGFLVVFVSLVFLASLTSTTIDPPKRLVMRLFRSDKSAFDRTEGLLDDPLMPLYPMAREPMFFVSFSIGDPLVPQLAIMDTGSTITWVICHNNFEHRTRDEPVDSIFNPRLSTTFEAMSCGDIDCPRNTPCPTPSSRCLFRNKYGSNSVGGAMGTEMFTFETYKDTNTEEELTFGCVDPFEAHRFSQDSRFNGIFALGDVDFIKLMGFGFARFSYCIGDLPNVDDASSYLHLGRDVELEGATTRLVVNEHGHYSVVVESIFLGDQELYSGGSLRIIIDTGSLFTYFVMPWYDRIEQKIRNVIKKLGFKNSGDRCYTGSVRNDLSKFPGLRLHFGRNVSMVLQGSHLFFQQSKDIFCFAIKPSTVGYTVLGSLSQQGFNMGFDIDANKLYFTTVDDCDEFI